MEKYLNYIKDEITKISDIKLREMLMLEIDCYILNWGKYKNEIVSSPIYNRIPELYDKHNFYFHTSESISISWDIDVLYDFAIKNLSIEHTTFQALVSLLGDDLSNSAEEIERVRAKVNSKQSHKYQPLLIMKYKPLNIHLLIDGRHRYIEYEKFNQTVDIPIYMVDDEMAMEAICLKNELMAYIIMHNIKVIYNIFIGEEFTLARLLDVDRYMKLT